MSGELMPAPFDESRRVETSDGNAQNAGIQLSPIEKDGVAEISKLALRLEEGVSIVGQRCTITSEARIGGSIQYF